MKYLGCAYYPEYWGRDRLETDILLMKEAGINTVRMGEFAWSAMEPREGEFALDWLHHTVKRMGENGIRVMLCTPTATPPAWLTASYPETLLVTRQGHRAEHGRRRQYCHNSEVYREYTRRIVDKLTREFSQYPNVVAWEIDNELGLEYDFCFCEICQEKFRIWLQKQHGSLENLNRHWATRFWSMEYSDWRQIRLGYDNFYHASSRNMDSKRFYSETMLEYAAQQAEIIRKNHPGALVTTNGMGPIYHSIDYYKLYSGMDTASDDLYFDVGTMDLDVLAMNFFRSLKPGKSFWITETGSGAMGNVGKPPVPKQLRAWMWSSYAHGADAYLIFRWRSCLSGQEQEISGILPHSGKPGQRYETVKSCFHELAKLREVLGELPLPEAKVAIMHDYDNLWSLDASRLNKEIDYQGCIFQLHEVFYRNHVLCDIVSPHSDLSGYKLVVLPNQIYLKEELAEKLKGYVSQGGVLLLWGPFGLRDYYGNYLPIEDYAGLCELTGVTLREGMFLKSHVNADESKYFPERKERNLTARLEGMLGDMAASGHASVWIGDVKVSNARVLLNFVEEAYAGQAAVTDNSWGKGCCIYAAVRQLDTGLMEQLIRYSLAASGIKAEYQTPAYVEAVQRGDVLFLINHRNEKVEVQIQREAEVLSGSLREGHAELDAFEVCCLRLLEP